MSISLGQRVKHWIKDAYSGAHAPAVIATDVQKDLLYTRGAKPNMLLTTVDAFRNAFVTRQDLEFSTRSSSACISVRA